MYRLLFLNLQRHVSFIIFKLAALSVGPVFATRGDCGDEELDLMWKDTIHKLQHIQERRACFLAEKMVNVFCSLK